jgi:hypothetical protein
MASVRSTEDFGTRRNPPGVRQGKSLDFSTPVDSEPPLFHEFPTVQVYIMHILRITAREEGQSGAARRSNDRARREPSLVGGNRDSLNTEARMRSSGKARRRRNRSAISRMSVPEGAKRLRKPEFHVAAADAATLRMSAISPGYRP